MLTFQEILEMCWSKR